MKKTLLFLFVIVFSIASNAQKLSLSAELGRNHGRDYSSKFIGGPSNDQFLFHVGSLANYA